MSDEPNGGADDAAPAGSDPGAGGSKLAEIMATRREKVARLREAGVDPYPPDFDPTHTLGAVRRHWHDLEAGEETGREVTVAGRVTAHRDLGSLAFLELLEDGEELQLFVADDALDEPSRALLEEVDVGDWLGATGEVMASRQGELSVRPGSLVLLSKSLRPLPDRFYGLSDVEQRYRRRELDLVVNQDSRRVFEIRAAALRALRSEMEDRGFLEVETPMLHPIPGGAAARPFVTHHNTLDSDLYLRVAPELYLKRLVAGGFPRVFELNRSFRNEGMSPRHNPEFTMLESYQAYGDHRDVMDLTEALLVRAAQEALGTTTLTVGGAGLSLEPPFDRRPMLELVREATGESRVGWDTPVPELRDLCDAHGVAWEAGWGTGRLIESLYESLAEDELWEPTFVTEHPLETSPLARRHRDKDHVAERFELVAGGHELANAFSELTDPDDQRRRFEEQAGARSDDELPAAVDEPYLRAMELGLPPTGGLGLGIDRLVMLLADVDNIREVILFPTLRPE